MARRNKTLKSRMHDVLSKKRADARAMTERGLSRHSVKVSTGQHGQPDYIWADQSYKNHVGRMEQFSKWLNKTHPAYKKVDVDLVDRDILKEYLLHQSSEGLSASTISADMAMLNKVFEVDLTKRELGLSARRIDEFVNNREGRSFEDLQAKEKDAILISRAFGFRRSELLQVNTKTFYQTEDGTIYAYISGKGGRVRVSECLESSKKWVLERFDGHVNKLQSIEQLDLDRRSYNATVEGADRLIANVRSSAPVHRLGRQFYAQQLLRQVEKEGRTGALLPQNRASITTQYKTNGILMSRYHAQVVSQNLGHSRIDVLKNYIH